MGLLSSRPIAAESRILAIPWIPTSSLQTAALYRAVKRGTWPQIVNASDRRLKCIGLDPEQSNPLVGLVNRDCRQFVQRLNQRDQAGDEHARFCRSIVDACYQRIIARKWPSAFEKRMSVRTLKSYMQQMLDCYDDEMS